MERFTEKTPGGAVNIHYPRKCFFPDGTSDKIAKSAFRQNAIEKLCAYEDTGLEPEEVNSVKLALMGKPVAEVKEFEGVPIDRIRELAQADREGRCAVLPCPNWLDIVFGEQEIFWGIDTDYKEYPIREITVRNEERLTWYNGWRTVVLKGADENGLDFEFPPDEIGKTVFLTREEAEKALGGGQDERN